jgi:hypothetical protein
MKRNSAFQGLVSCELMVVPAEFFDGLVVNADHPVEIAPALERALRDPKVVNR